MKVVVIGAGIGGLTAGSILAKAGLDVTVLEAHVYPGGCAGTFFHQGYQFDAGATLAAGFYPDGPMDRVAQAAGIETWDFQPLEPAMVVHLPNRDSVIRWGDHRRHQERMKIFGPGSDKFWAWQERTADYLWPLALQSPPWPPQSLNNLNDLFRKGVSWLGKVKNPVSMLQLLRDATSSVSTHLNGAPDKLVQFIDAQLLISAQTTSQEANALFGAAALDLPRRGPVYPSGGIGTISKKIVDSIKKNHGHVLYRMEAARIILENHKPTGVETKRGEWFPADVVVANLPPWNIHRLVAGQIPGFLDKQPSIPSDGWGAFTIYAGVDESVFPGDMPLHHQILITEPLGEGNSVFLSISPPWDGSRAPLGHRAVTLSTHTSITPWWKLHQEDIQSYNKRKEEYTYKILKAVDKIMPGFYQGTTLALPGTPITFQRFTRRTMGWVGGFPQTNLFRPVAPRLLRNLWIVGDSIFPGQSIPAVALGGLRVARSILLESGHVKIRNQDNQEKTIQPLSEQIRDLA